MMVTFTRKQTLAASCAGLLIGAVALAWSPAAWGQGAGQALQAQESHPRGMDRSLPGMQKGVLTKAHNGIVSIDRTTYTFAADAVIENKSRRSFQAKELKWEGVEYPVDYWLEAESSGKQIAQMVIYFPE